jgi:hypothetical protein
MKLRIATNILGTRAMHILISDKTFAGVGGMGKSVSVKRRGKDLLAGCGKTILAGPRRKIDSFDEASAQ